MSTELDCRWHFAPHSGQETGPNNAMMQNFRSQPYESLVREAVQNSLDAVDDRTKPVKVVFSVGIMKSQNYPNFFELSDHILACGDYYDWNDKAVEYYKKVDPQFGTNEDLRALVDEAHALGIRVMLDAVFNHTGTDHPMWEDILANGRESRYADCWSGRGGEDREAA